MTALSFLQSVCFAECAALYPFDRKKENVTQTGICKKSPVRLLIEGCLNIFLGEKKHKSSELFIFVFFSMFN
jgi:hypothetical protein